MLGTPNRLEAIMLGKFLDNRRKRRAARQAPAQAQFDRVASHFPVLGNLGGPRREQLYRRTCEILAAKEFVGAAGLELTAEHRLAVAILAALPVLELGVRWYRDFHTFILYPAGFVADAEEVDEAGVVHRGRDLRVGEAWARGPVVLSFDDVWASGQGEGFNVVVHELAHQIDQLNGEMDGFPPLHTHMNPEAWSRTFTNAYESLSRTLDAGREPALDPYAAESPAEFFAVASEYYFDAPDWLRQHEPEIHRQLESFYTRG